MGFGRNEDILQAIIDGTDSSTLPKPQSREERLLHAILDKINSGGGGGGSAGLSIHFCTENEYNLLTGLPTVENPSETTFYLVPTGTGDNNLYDEWVYINGAWEHFGSGAPRESYDGTYYIEPDTDISVPIRGIITNPQAGQTLLFDATSGKWINANFENGVTYTFSEGDENGTFKVEDSDGNTQTVTVHGLLPFCFSDNDEEIIFDSGSIDD